jgi:hypothetical protein
MRDAMLCTFVGEMEANRNCGGGHENDSDVIKSYKFHGSGKKIREKRSQRTHCQDGRIKYRNMPHELSQNPQHPQVANGTIKASGHDKNAPGTYIKWDAEGVEVIPDDEEEKIREVSAQFNRFQMMNFNEHMHCFRGTHLKTHGVRPFNLDRSQKL